MTMLIKRFFVRNFQCMIQFYSEYNKKLTMVKTITQRPVADLERRVRIAGHRKANRSVRL